MKDRVLCILQLPPPVGGVTMINQSITESSIIGQYYSLDVIPIQFSKQMKNIGRFSVLKLFVLGAVVLKTIRKLLTNRYRFIYFTLNLNGMAFYRDLILVGILKLFRQKCLFHLHGKGQNISYAQNFLKLSLYRFIFKNNLTILISPLLLNEMEDFLKPDQIFYCLNGIKPTVAAGDLEKANQIRKADHKTKIIFLGHLWTLKGCYLLLEALNLLKKKGHDFEAVFVGTEIDITPQDFSKRCIALNISDRVSYLGPLYGAKKTEQLLQADIFAYPTLNDSFGLVLLEAMEAGLPIVASEEGSIPEIIIHNESGFIVPKNSVQALADQLTVLFNDPALRFKMGQAGRARFEQQFTVEKFENNLLKIFNQV
jgi:glycosyltransferase involved in cell wall biosynthesis